MLRPSGATFFSGRLTPGHRCVRDVHARIEVATESPSGRPCSHTAQGNVQDRQKHEAGAGKLPDGRVAGGTENHVPGRRRIAQIPHERAPIVDGAMADVAEGLRMSGGRRSGHESQER